MFVVLIRIYQILIFIISPCASEITHLGLLQRPAVLSVQRQSLSQDYRGGGGGAEGTLQRVLVTLSIRHHTRQLLDMQADTKGVSSIWFTRSTTSVSGAPTALSDELIVAAGTSHASPS